MRIGIAFDLKPADRPAAAPDDLYEEFDAPATIRAVADALRRLGHEAVELGNGRPLVAALLADPPDAVFNLAEGAGAGRCREARVPAVCELLGIPYTGSDPLALAAALDKDVTRRLAADAGVAVPAGFAVGFDPAPYDGDFAEYPALLEAHGLSLPVVAKPAYEGSSKGIRGSSLVTRPEDLGPVVRALAGAYRQPVVVEEYVGGVEVTVGVVGNDPPEPFGLMAIHPVAPTDHFVYGLEVKRAFRTAVRYKCPAELPPAVAREVEAAALAAFAALGCRDVARLDFRVRDGVPYLLDVNPLPGLNPDSSDLVIMAGLLGVTHADLVGMIWAAAEARWAAAPG